jgi:hypothetical protein
MAGFANTVELVDALTDDGQSWMGSFRKVPSQATTAGAWVDLSMAAGKPAPQYYAASPLVAATLDGSRGMDHGRDVSPARKFLASSLLMGAHANVNTATSFLFADLLLYYPFIDTDSLDLQEMTNYVDSPTTADALPRYTDGAGVQMMLVALAPYVAGGSITVSYTNSAGVAGRSTGAVALNASGAISNLMTSGSTTGGAGPFLPLQSGDSGVRSVESVTCSAPNTGLAALVLVKPLATTQLADASLQSCAETDHLLEHGLMMPRIEDGAYLSLLAQTGASIATQQIMGTITTVWG